MLVLATCAVAWTVAIDLLAAASGQHLLGWGLALGPAVLLMLFTWLPFGPAARRPRGMTALALLAAVLVVAVPWNQRKRFVHDVLSIRPGMTVDEVEHAMASYRKGSGAKWQVPAADELQTTDATPAEAMAAARTDHARDLDELRRRPYFTGTTIYRWSTDAEYDSDWGLVEFVAGRVVKVQFLPD